MPDRRLLTYTGILWVGLQLQLLSGLPLWGHTSAPAQILGRYSNRYALILGVHVALALLSLALVMLGGERVRAGVARVPRAARGVLSAALIAGAAGVWVLSLEPHVLAYVGLNALWALALLHFATPDEPRPARVWMGVSVAACVLLFVPLLLTALTVFGYHPDEAHYTDYASTFWAEGKLYDSAWLETPYAIEPGWAWQLAAYGWLLETFGYTVYIGRLVNFISYVLCFVGLYAVGAHLYGRRAGLLMFCTAFLSIAFIPEWDYSPNHLLMPVGAWSFYVLLRAKSAQRARVRYTLYALLGLMLTLSLNVHAAGVVFAVGYSLWLTFAASVAFWRERDWRAALLPLVAFGVGAAGGTLTYYLTNIAPVGGLTAYLDVLTAWGGANRNDWFFYTWESLLERLLIVTAVLFLALRRLPADRDALSGVLFITATAWFLDTQGYIWHFGTFYFVALGAGLAALVPAEGQLGGRRAAWLLSACVILLAAQVSSLFVNWGTVRSVAQTGALPPYFYNELKEILPAYVRDTDTIYTTHQLIWVFPHTAAPPRIVTYGAEFEGMQRYGLASPVEVWEQVQPTVIIFIEGQMSFDVGMQAYMQAHPFEVCHVLTRQAIDVTIYRPNCADSPQS